MRNYCHRILIQCRTAQYVVWSLAFFNLAFSSAHATPFRPTPPPDIKATSAILVDAETGQVLYERNADQPLPPASTTKLMTAILLEEYTKPDDILTASKKAANEGGSSLHLKEGEKISAHDLLYALMLRSANDGCVVAAEHISGSEAKFAELMTKKAREIGAEEAFYHNCNGLNQNPNSISARDLSIIARYALRIPAINKAVATKYYVVHRSMDQQDTHLVNHDRFLWNYPGADGVKTGFTDPAGHCFVGSAIRNGWRLVSVVMHSPHWMHETIALMNYGFHNFEPVVIADAGKTYADAKVLDGVSPTVGAVLPQSIHCVVRKGTKPNYSLKVSLDDITAPVYKGERIGTLETFLNGNKLDFEPLIADKTVRVSTIAKMRHLALLWLLLPVALGGLLVRYGTTITKNTRVRRHRIATYMRISHQGRPRHGERNYRSGNGGEGGSREG